MGSKSREVLFGGDIRWAAERAKEARQKADALACDAWTKRMLGYGGPAQPSPTLGDALNARMRFLEVKCLGCETHNTVDLTIVRRRRKRLSTSWSGGCAARIARKSAATHTSEATLWPSVPPRFLPTTLRHMAIPENGNVWSRDLRMIGPRSRSL